jgi:serine/threonine protein kinase
MKEIQSGSIIDERYKVVKILGTGGFGQVFQVEDLNSDNNFALKICYSNNEEDNRRFMREVRLMESIDHKNIIKVLYSNLDSNPRYFVMPLAKYSLEKIIDYLQGDKENTLKIFVEICEGINALHSSGKVHRDIKPLNVLVTKDNQIVVSDLGLGKFEERDSVSITSSGTYIGTEEYIPPEYKFRGGTKNADVRGDIYQLGKTLYNMMTGMNPLYIDTKMLPPVLAHIILKATNENPDERYQTVSELVDSVKVYLYSLNPAEDPKAIFEQCLSESDILLSEGGYEKDTVIKLINVLYQCKDDTELFLDLFDKIPPKLLKLILSEMDEEFGSVLEEYSQVLENLFTERYYYSYTYAEVVARRMKIVYENTSKINNKVLAPKNILKASVNCNRWAAMDVFDDLILNIKNENEAIAIAEMLNENMYFYANLAERLEKKKLHPVIQKIWQKAVGEELSGSDDSRINTIKLP